MNEKQIKAINDAMSFLTMAAANLDKYPSSQDFSDLRRAHIAAMEEAGISGHIWSHFDNLAITLELNR